MKDRWRKTLLTLGLVAGVTLLTSSEENGNDTARLCFGPGVNLIDQFSSDTLINLRRTRDANNSDNCWIPVVAFFPTSQIDDSVLGPFLTSAQQLRLLPVLRIDDDDRTITHLSPNKAKEVATRLTQSPSIRNFPYPVLIQIGNEPNIKGENLNSNFPDPEEFAKSFFLFVQSLDKGRSSNLSILLPAVSLCGGDCQPPNISPEAFQKRVFKFLRDHYFDGSVEKTSVWLDQNIGAVGLHLYAPAGQSQKITADAARSLAALKNAGFPIQRKPIIVTEMGLNGGSYNPITGKAVCEFDKTLKKVNPSIVSTSIFSWTRSSDKKQTTVHLFAYPANSCASAVEIK